MKKIWKNVRRFLAALAWQSTGTDEERERIADQMERDGRVW